MILMLFISGCNNKNQLPGSSIDNYEAIKESMSIATSKTKEKKCIDPVIGLCLAVEDPVEPDQLIIDKCYYHQKFKVLEKISGFIENEFNCSYSISLSQNEQSIKKNSILILILGEEKSKGNYHLIKALENTKANQQTIQKNWR